MVFIRLRFELSIEMSLPNCKLKFSARISIDALHPFSRSLLLFSHMFKNVTACHYELSYVFITTDGNCLECAQLPQHHHRAALSEIETLRNTGTKIVKEVNVLFTRVEIKTKGNK